jgi:hypothetical protein
MPAALRVLAKYAIGIILIRNKPGRVFFLDATQPESHEARIIILLSRDFLSRRPKLRPPFLRSSANPGPCRSGHHAFLNDFQFFARGMTKRFSSRSNSAQLVLKPLPNCFSSFFCSFNEGYCTRDSARMRAIRQ